MEKISFVYKNIYKEGINLNLVSKNKNAVLKELFKGMENAKCFIDKEKAFEDLLSREIIGSTGIGCGFAIPHAKTSAVNDIIISIGVLKEAIEFDSIDNTKVNIIFMFFAPEDKTSEFLVILAKISRYIQNEEFREKIIMAKTSDELISEIKKFELN